MCNNVLLHLPSIVKPIAELSRVARRFILIRTLIGDESFRIQEVFSKETWPFSTVPTDQEFDDSGEPTSFGYENIYSWGYSLVHSDSKITLFTITDSSNAVGSLPLPRQGTQWPTRIIRNAIRFSHGSDYVTLLQQRWDVASGIINRKRDYIPSNNPISRSIVDGRKSLERQPMVFLEEVNAFHTELLGSTGHRARNFCWVL